MRCPDCGHDVPIKPEVVVQKEPCKCGLTSEVRNTRIIALCILSGIVAAFGSCLGSEYMTMKQVETMKDHYEIRDKSKVNLPPAEKMGLPFDVVPKKKD